MIEIGKQEQLTLRQAEQIEEQYRKELNADMNGRSCFRTEEERKEYIKEWRENNKEERKEKSKEWRENNKEHIKEYAQTDEYKANRQTPEFKASKAIADKKYRDKIKLQKEQLKNNKE